MSWSVPPIFSVGDVLTAANLNFLGGDLGFLYGDTNWTTPATGNGWVNAGGGQNAIAYRLAGRFVYFRGVANGVTINLAAYTLPVGYRPVAISPLATTANGAHAVLSVGSGGDVTPTVGSVTAFSFEGLFVSVS